MLPESFWTDAEIRKAAARIEAQYAAFLEMASPEERARLTREMAEQVKREALSIIRRRRSARPALRRMLRPWFLQVTRWAVPTRRRP
jgi:hypothetical protein